MPCWVVSLISQMVCKFGIQGPFQQRLRQPLEQPILANNVFRFLVPLQQFVYEIGFDVVHLRSPFIMRRTFTQNILWAPRSVRISRTTRSCTFHDKAYATYSTGA